MENGRKGKRERTMSFRTKMTKQMKKKKIRKRKRKKNKEREGAADI